MPWYGQFGRPVAQDDVLALMQDRISGFLERPYCIKMVDTWKLGQGSRCHIDDANVLTTDLIIHDRQVFGNG